MRARCGDKHLLFKRRNHSFTGADFRDNSSLQLSAIDTDDNLIDHLLRELFHATGRNMLGKKSILIIACAGHHVDAGIAHQVEHELRITPHIAVGHLNNVADT